MDDLASFASVLCKGENRRIPLSATSIDDEGNLIHGDHFVATGAKTGNVPGPITPMVEVARAIVALDTASGDDR